MNKEQGGNSFFWKTPEKKLLQPVAFLSSCGVERIIKGLNPLLRNDI
jgi:hypothetical protein